MENNCRNSCVQSFAIFVRCVFQEKYFTFLNFGDSVCRFRWCQFFRAQLSCRKIQVTAVTRNCWIWVASALFSRINSILAETTQFAGFATSRVRGTLLEIAPRPLQYCVLLENSANAFFFTLYKIRLRISLKPTVCRNQSSNIEMENICRNSCVQSCAVFVRCVFQEKHFAFLNFGDSVCRFSNVSSFVLNFRVATFK